MAKPIFIIGWPFAQADEQDGPMDFFDLQRSNEESYAELLKETEKLKDEYHLLVYTKPGGEPVFHAFYDKDFDEKKAEEINGLIDGLMKIPVT